MKNLTLFNFGACMVNLFERSSDTALAKKTFIEKNGIDKEEHGP